MSESTFWKRAKVIVKVIEVRLRFIAVLVAVALFFGYWDTIKNVWDKFMRPAATVAALDDEHEFFCPMHPQVTRQTYEANGEVPKCPICGMPLSPRIKPKPGQLPPGVTGRVQLSPERVQLAGVQTVTVAYRPIRQQVTTVGQVTYDESRLSRIVSRVGGYVEKLYVDRTLITVKQGDPLAEIYSPELYSAAQELLLVVNRAAASDLAESTRRRLRLLGVSDQEIEAIVKSGQAVPRLVVRSPRSGYVISKPIVAGSRVDEGMTLLEVADLSVVWIEAEIYDKDIARLRPGQAVEATIEGLSGQAFSGKVALISPQVDAATRTTRVRFEVDNAGGQLRPGMYATVRIEVPLVAPAADAGDRAARVRIASHQGPASPSPQPPLPGTDKKLVGETGVDGEYLTVPERAVIDTGTKQIVYVEREEGLFEGREVKLGPRSGDYYPVLAGLQPGDRIAAAGAFLIDAETRLNPAAAATYFGASGGPSTTTNRSVTPGPSPQAPTAKPPSPSTAPPAASEPEVSRVTLGAPVAPGNVASLRLVKRVEPSPQALANIDKLPSEDRAAALAQATCPVRGLALGAMGKPIKITLNGQAVYLCCKGCALEARTHADEVVRRAAEFKKAAGK